MRLSKKFVLSNLTWAAAAFGLGVVIVIISASQLSKLPLESSLEEVRGQVAWVQKYKYDIRFGLGGTVSEFKYSRSQRVFDALSDAGRNYVLVYYDPAHSYGPIWSKKRYFPVFGIEIDGEPVVSYEQVSKGEESDNKFGYWLGGFFMLLGILSAIKAKRIRMT